MVAMLTDNNRWHFMAPEDGKLAGLQPVQLYGGYKEASRKIDFGDEAAVSMDAFKVIKLTFPTTLALSRIFEADIREAFVKNCRIDSNRLGDIIFRESQVHVLITADMSDMDLSPLCASLALQTEGFKAEIGIVDDLINLKSGSREKEVSLLCLTSREVDPVKGIVWNSQVHNH